MKRKLGTILVLRCFAVLICAGSALALDKKRIQRAFARVS